MTTFLRSACPVKSLHAACLFLLCGVLLAAVGLVSTAKAAEATLQAGAATSNITPPLGLPIIGGFSPAPSETIHDELHARCFVVDDGKTKVALVICDLLGVHRLVSDEARRLIEEETKIPAANVLISGTHTHSASSALGTDRLRFEQTLDDYQKFVARRIADGVRRAVHHLRPAEIAFGTVDVPEHLNNRRWFMRPGTMPMNPFGETNEKVKMNPPGGSSDLIEPAGPIDPAVSFFALREAGGGRPIGLYATYSLHYVGGVKGHAISADYFALFAEEAMRRWNAERLDPPFVGAMANGTSGDINNNNFVKPRGRKEPYEQMRYVAADVAEKVAAAVPTLTFRNDLTVDARFREITLGWRHPTAEQLAWAKRILADPAKAPNRVTSVAYAERFLRLADYPETGNLPVQVLRIGDVVVGTIPCEVFAEIGLEFKQRSPQKPAFLVSLGHGYYGYLPTPRHFELGGYETWLGTNRLEPTASVKFVDELLRMVEEVRPTAK